MSITWFDHTTFKIQPWKNGQGETLELYRLVDPQSLEDFLFRLSMAKIDTSGPFSLFPGIERQLILLEGEGLQLKRENGELLTLKKMQGIEFSGEEKIEGFVSSPCKDFNIMTKRNWKKPMVRVIHLPKKGVMKLSGENFLYQVSGELKYEEETRGAGTLWKTEERIEIESMTDSTSILITLI